MTRSAPRRWKSADILERLHCHYLGSEMFAGGELATEVGINDGVPGSTSRCDAVFVGFTPTWGRVMVGHEIKVSRTDWLRELDNTFKASTWADACHAWMVVAPDTLIVRPEEVPPGWGLMVPDSRRARKLKVIIKPDARPETWSPPWWAVRSVMKRLNTLRGSEIIRLSKVEATSQVTAAIKDMDRRAQLLGKRGLTEADQDALSTVAAFTEYGVRLTRWRDTNDQDAVTPEDLASVAVRQALRSSTSADDAVHQLTLRFSGAVGVLDAAQRLADAVAKLGTADATE